MVNVDNLRFILLKIYGYNNITENKRILDEITSHIEPLKTIHSTENIILGGDLNLVNDDFYDKFPSKFLSSHPNTIFNNFCNELSLTDAWRHLNPAVTQYSWFSPNYNSKSRIDHWIIANHLLNYDVSSIISAAPLTDHCTVSIVIKPKAKTPINSGNLTQVCKRMKHIAKTSDY